MDSGDQGNAERRPHCKWCGASIETSGWCTRGPSLWAAWIAGYCSPLHMNKDAGDLVNRGAVWWIDSARSAR